MNLDDCVLLIVRVFGDQCLPELLPLAISPLLGALELFPGVLPHLLVRISVVENDAGFVDGTLALSESTDRLDQGAQLRVFARELLQAGEVGHDLRLRHERLDLGVTAFYLLEPVIHHRNHALRLSSLPGRADTEVRGAPARPPPGRRHEAQGEARRLPPQPDRYSARVWLVSAARDPVGGPL